MARQPQTVDVKRQSWCGTRSAMIVMAFSMVLDPIDIPSAEIIQLHKNLDYTTPMLEAKLTELASKHGFTLRFT